MFILPTDLDEQGIDNVLARVDEELQRLNGSVTASERLGRRSFARTMQKKDAGQYVKMTLSMEPASVQPFLARLKLVDGVFRVQLVNEEKPKQAPADEKPKGENDGGIQQGDSDREPDPGS
jgi:ribosomal protein S6